MTAVSDRIDVALPRRATLAAWDEDLCLRESAYELVEGVPTMPPPSEGPMNRSVGMLLAMAINRRRRAWLAVEELDVTLEAGERPTVRRPDVVVADRAVFRRPESSVRRVDAADVLLAAEIVSASSVERDHVTKRAEYARAGIPAYLVVDLQDAPGSLWLYEARDERGEFVDVEPADRVTLQVGGVRVPLRVTDLIA